MQKIHKLSPHVADLIAAGEVVERPASVVKELVENSLDAGASAITVEIERGGLTYMRVTDNGTGMNKEDAATAFLRHTTSKIVSDRDLESIETLGFRGEALAAIASVSRIDLFTRQANSQEGTALTLEAGTLTECLQSGTAEGTSIIVRDLFFNTPARLKFMKSDRAEAAAITALMTAIALSHPHIRFRYLRDNKEIFHTPGDSNLSGTIYTLLGRTFAKDLIETKSKDTAVSVSGFITAPALSHGSRSHQYFYVNGRLVRSQLLQAALEQAYRNVQFTGRFPGCVLYVTLKHHLLDVNVHPTKTEIKFLHDKEVFDAVYYTVLSHLKENRYTPELRLPDAKNSSVDFPKKDTPPKPAPIAMPKPVQNNTLSTDLGLPLPPIKLPTKAETPTEKLPLFSDDGLLAQAAAVLYTPDPMQEKIKDAIPFQSEDTKPVLTENLPPAPLPKSAQKAKTTEQSSLHTHERIPPYRVIGETLSTYILVEQENALFFIDKHAAHERILFDKLKDSNFQPMPQTLLEPITISLGAQASALLADHTHLLEPFGFSYNQFGSDTLAIRSVPGDLIEIDELEHFLGEIAEGISLGKSPNLDKVRDKILHTLACKAAIKAGKQSTTTELETLAKLVLSGTVQYCPHGRPVFLRLDKGHIDRQVRR